MNINLLHAQKIAGKIFPTTIDFVNLGLFCTLEKHFFDERGFVFSQFQKTISRVTSNAVQI